MVNGQSATLIFVYDSKGRTRNCGVAFQTRDETLREQRFAAAQFAFKSQHGTRKEILRKSPRERFRFSGAVGNEGSHGATCDWKARPLLRIRYGRHVICD